MVMIQKIPKLTFSGIEEDFWQMCINLHNAEAFRSSLEMNLRKTYPSAWIFNNRRGSAAQHRLQKIEAWVFFLSQMGVFGITMWCVEWPPVSQASGSAVGIDKCGLRIFRIIL